MDKPKVNLGGLNPPSTYNKISKGIFTARVRFAILEDKSEPKIFKEFGGWGSLGCIFFSSITNPNKDKSFISDSFARPLFPNIKHIPLNNEIVYIISLPSNNIQNSIDNSNYYYFQPVNIWNNSHHNAIPDPINGEDLPPTQQQDYEETRVGNVRRVGGGVSEIDLGKTFKEKLDIRNTQPFEGDIIYEGRWGNSIRYGSTVKNSTPLNTWSEAGEDGDPIIIIKNGQYEESSEPWVPQVEDINKDKSVIFLTSTQKLPINVASKDYKSYNSPPTSPNEYAGMQIMFNSGRLLFNSKEDSILFSAKKTINLNSIKSVNIDSPKVHVNTKAIRLGDKDATEPMIFGDMYLKDFEHLLKQIIKLSKALQKPIGTSVPYQLQLAIPPPAIKLEHSAQVMLTKIDAYKSKITKST